MPCRATDIAKQAELALRFDSNGGHAKAEAVSKPGNRADNSLILLVLRKCADKGAIDFHTVEGKSFQLRKRGGTGAEIVKDYPDPSIGQLR